MRVELEHIAWLEEQAVLFNERTGTEEILHELKALGWSTEGVDQNAYDYEGRVAILDRLILGLSLENLCR